MKEAMLPTKRRYKRPILYALVACLAATASAVSITVQPGTHHIADRAGDFGRYAIERSVAGGDWLEPADNELEGGKSHSEVFFSAEQGLFEHRNLWVSIPANEEVDRYHRSEARSFFQFRVSEPLEYDITGSFEGVLFGADDGAGAGMEVRLYPTAEPEQSIYGETQGYYSTVREPTSFSFSLASSLTTGLISAGSYVLETRISMNGYTGSGDSGNSGAGLGGFRFELSEAGESATVPESGRSLLMLAYGLAGLFVVRTAATAWQARAKIF